MQRRNGPSFFLGALDVLPPQAIAITRGPSGRTRCSPRCSRSRGQWREISVMMTYLFQGWNCRGPQKYKDMILDIGTEEIGHLEMLAAMIARLLETSPVEQQEDMPKNSLLGAVMGGARIEDAIVAGMNPQHVVVSGLGATPTDSVGFPWTSRYMIASGNLLPGDIPDLQSLHLEVMDHSLATVVASKVAFIPHEAVRSFLRAHPRIADVFWRDTLIDAAVFREWVVNVGRREAYGRISHLLCEVYVRLKAVGLANGQAFEMPVTQAELGDATGMSNVHVNRTLQELRRDGLISTPKSGRVVIERWDGLQHAGEFDATYLHIKNQAASHVAATSLA
jgi:CRP-like cAMP-binding protein